MCGLVGVAGDIFQAHEKLFRLLLIFDVVRGEDSTGVAGVGKYTNDLIVAKELGDPFNLFNSNKFEKMLKRSNKLLMGHNRYATSGGVSKAGAHPFDFDTLVGAHNGTLGSRYRLDDDRDFKVDSEALYHNIEKNGLKETIRRLGAKGNAWSLTWWNKDESTINFLRNEERPMFMCRTEDGKVLAWASEYWMLDVAFGRVGLKRTEIFETKEHAHISIEIDNKGVLQKPHVAEIIPDPVVYLPQQKPPVNTQKPAHIALVPTKPNAATAGNLVVSTVKEHVDATKAANAPVVAPKEVDVVKKAVEDVSKGQGLASNPSYLQAKKVRFEILKGNVDGNGARYLSLFDPLEPFIDIRLYPHRTDEHFFDMEGADVIGNISEWGKKDETALRPYYKVSPWEVKLDETPLINPALLFNTEEPEEEMTVVDHTGRLITETEFKKKYGVCGWCNDHLSILNRNRYSTAGECFCPDCANNTEVNMYVNII